MIYFISYKRYLVISLLSLLCFLAFASCKKYLDAKPDQKLAIISTLDDCESLLDNNNVINMSHPAEAEVLSDNYYVQETRYSGLGQYDRDLYIWTPNENFGQTWFLLYRAISYANNVLDAIDKLDESESERKNWIKGNAYFTRAFNLAIASELYSLPYRKNTANEIKGVPIRLNSNFNEKSIRGSLRETYDLIISDLKTAGQLLPNDNAFKTRGSKPAAFGALAHIYLTMQEYDSALKYASAALNIIDTLIDFNALSSTSSAPISPLNPEVIYHTQSPLQSILQPTNFSVDTSLYQSYSDFDRRKKIFFRLASNGVTHTFQNGYSGATRLRNYVFGGIAVDELYLIKSESLARNGQVDSAMHVLNKLLKKRYETGHFQEVAASSIEEALSIVLNERRKELVFRGKRWSDMRRLKDDPIYAIIPKRIIEGNVYELLPGSNRYALKIPADVINMSGIEQNP